MNTNGTVLNCSTCGALSSRTILLDCLHNCCDQCYDLSHSDEVKCPKCDSVTDVGSADIQHHVTVAGSAAVQNSFVAAQVKTLELSGGSGKCDACPAKGRTGETADVWCSDCCQALCAGCASDHKVFCKAHETKPLQEAVASREISRSIGLSCQMHAKTLDFLCIQCQEFKCNGCMKTCLDAGHSLENRLSERSKRLTADIAKCVLEQLEKLENEARSLDQHSNLLKQLSEARTLHLEILQRNKRTVLTAVNRAYSEAEQSLEDLYAVLASQAGDTAEAIAQLHDRATQATGYTKQIVDSQDLTSLLRQRQQILYRIKALTEQASKLLETAEKRSCVAVQSELPSSVDKICQSWVGVPTLLPGSAEPLWEPKRFCEEPSFHDCEETFEDLNAGFGCVSTLWTDASTFEVPQRCSDVAVTTEDTLVLAALKDGLKEYDYRCKELSAWRPSQLDNDDDEAVWTVDCLDDGRVVVGLFGSHRVMILKRSPELRNTWIEEKTIASIKSCHSVAVRGDVLAAAEWHSAKLVMVCLPCMRELCRRKLSYNVSGLSVTDSTVITSSNSPVKCAEGSERYVMDGYGLGGDFLWRHTWKERVWDMCIAPSAKVLFVALADSSRVTMISFNERLQPADILSSSKTSHEQAQPLCLSHTKGLSTAVAVLSRNQTTLTIYPVSRSLPFAHALA